MKIIGPRDGPRPESLTGGQTARPATTAPAPTAPQGEDVRISGLSGTLTQLGARLAAEGEFDQSRVDQITSAIAKGEYKVNAEAVADKLIQSVRELLGRKA